MRSRLAHLARRVPVQVLAAALVLGSGDEASAQPAPAPAVPKVVYPVPHVHVWTRLTYALKPGTEACLDEAAFRLLAANVEDPFEPDPQGVYAGEIRVVVWRSPEGFVAEYTWTGSPDVTVPAHRIAVSGHSWSRCYDALSTLALAVSVQHDVLQMDYAKKYAPNLRDRLIAACPAPRPEPVATVPGCFESPYAVWPRQEAPVPAEYERPKPPERWPVAVRLGVTGGIESVAAGWGSLALAGEVGVRYRAVSLGLEVHGDPSISSQFVPNEGTVRFSRISGGLLLCGHHGIFAACGVYDEGRILFPNHIAQLPASTLYAAAGARAALEFPIAPPYLFLGALVDMRAAIRPTPLMSNMSSATTIFAPAAPGFTFGAGLRFELWR
jgi:hypothetical protein